MTGGIDCSTNVTSERPRRSFGLRARGASLLGEQRSGRVQDRDCRCDDGVVATVDRRIWCENSATFSTANSAANIAVLSSTSRRSKGHQRDRGDDRSEDEWCGLEVEVNHEDSVAGHRDVLGLVVYGLLNVFARFDGLRVRCGTGLAVCVAFGGDTQCAKPTSVTATAS